jgi:hypothetical protein
VGPVGAVRLVVQLDQSLALQQRDISDQGAIKYGQIIDPCRIIAGGN